MISFKIENDTFIFEGTLNSSEASKAFDDAFSKLTSASIAKFDFSGVTTANSTGIIELFNFLKKLTCTIEHHNTPVWLLDLFNMVEGIHTDNTKVKSIQLPYQSESSGKEILKIYTFGESLPDQKNYDDVEIDLITVDGEEFEGDFDLPTLLMFKNK